MGLPWWLRWWTICRAEDVGSIPGSGRSHGEGNGLPAPVFLSGEFHEQRSLVGYRGRRLEHDWSNGWPFFICTLSLGSQTRVILNTLSFPGLSPQDLWQCLETFWLSQLEGLEGGGEWCYWYLVNRDKGVAKHPTMSRAALHSKKWSGPKCVCCQETLVLAELVQETPS